MTLFIASLNSGSNGNCYYIGNGEEAILVDAGLSCRETERRMRRLGLSMTRLKAVFISHEHDDHIRGLEVLSRRHQLPVYITEQTLRECRFTCAPQLVNHFDADQPVTIGALTVTAFSKTHDASDPYSFTVASPTVRIGVFTDIGIVCDNLVRHFTQCHAAFLEANYDEELLEKGHYPWPLKNRIRGGHGHLSNRQALELFVDYRPPFLSHLLLSHLSEDNNRPHLVQTLFDAKAQGATIAIASRYNESEVYAITGRYAGIAGPAWTPEGLAKPRPTVAPSFATASSSPPQSVATAPTVNPTRRRRTNANAQNQPVSIQTSLF